MTFSSLEHTAPSRARAGAGRQISVVRRSSRSMENKMRWILAQPISWRMTVNESMLCGLGVQQVVFNFYDKWGVCPPSRQGCRIQCTNVVGMKGLFWKKILTPAIVTSFDVVWLLDTDVQPYWTFSTAHIEAWLEHSNASVLQPSILASADGIRVSDKEHTIQGRFAQSCAAVRGVVEVQSPIFTASYWNRFHTLYLSQMPSTLLSTSVWQMDDLWFNLCPEHAPSLIVKDVHVVHYDTRSYDLLSSPSSGISLSVLFVWLSSLFNSDTVPRHRRILKGTKLKEWIEKRWIVEGRTVDPTRVKATCFTPPHTAAWVIG